MPVFPWIFDKFPIGHMSNIGGEAEPLLDDFQAAFSEITTPKITGNSSTFDGSGDWLEGLGGLVPDINSTIAGAMYLNFTSGNQAVKITAVDTTNYFLVRVKAYKVSGTGMPLRIGAFAGGLATYNNFDAIPTSESRWFYAYIWGLPSTDFWIGAITAENNGTKIAIEEVHCEQVTTADILSEVDYDLLPLTNYANLYDNVSKSNQTLLVVGMNGDSIMANSYASAISGDEGDTLRPPRLTTNTIPRRLYDKLKYNAPLFRRLDHADWTHSDLGGGGDDFSVLSLAADLPFSPLNTDEKYFRTVEPEAYCEIDIPDGYENCAFVYRKTYQWSDLAEFDSAVAITLNAGSIAAYGDSTIDETALDDVGDEDSKGYGLNLAIYEGLPSGVNTIRLTKSNDALNFHLWGVLYWSGNSMVLLNNAYNGQTIEDLSAQSFQHTLVNTFDLGLMQLPNQNNSSKDLELYNQAAALCRFLNNAGYPLDKTLLYGTNPFGILPSVPTTNYYALNTTPNFKDCTELDMKLLGYFGVNYIDVFRYFETDIISRGGTLEGGEAGNYYTDDGQHPNDDGADAFDTFLVDKLSAIPE